ncbi:MAG: TIM barrel protein [Lentisphaeria bacterium]
MTQIKGGLVSITFRDLIPSQIIDLVAESGLSGIEWGGDIHVPHGEAAVAERVGERTRTAGLEVAAYGSYYRAAESKPRGLEFSTVCDTAMALGADVIRVWAGAKSSEEADLDYRLQVRDDLLRIADHAGEYDIKVEMEYHGGTLTDTNESAVQLAKEAEHPNLLFGWQPPNGQPYDYSLSGLRAIKHRLCHLHVFHWSVESGKGVKHPLAEGSSVWPGYIREAEATPGQRYALIEFVADGTPEQFRRDATTLQDWLNPSGNPEA